MKTFILIWIIVQTLLIIGGWLWAWSVWKDEKRRKLPLYLTSIGNLMMAIFFLVLMPMMKK